jgi:hypothetical protein
MAHPLATKAISAARVTNDAVDDLGPSVVDQPAGRGLDRPTRRPGRPAGWSAPGLGWSGCGRRGQSQLHALLADLGVVPELRTLFGPAGRRWLADLRMPASARGRLEPACG